MGHELRVGDRVTLTDDKGLKPWNGVVTGVDPASYKVDVQWDDGFSDRWEGYFLTKVEHPAEIT